MTTPLTRSASTLPQSGKNPGPLIRALQACPLAGPAESAVTEEWASSDQSPAKATEPHTEDLVETARPGVAEQA